MTSNWSDEDRRQWQKIEAAHAAPMTADWWERGGAVEGNPRFCPTDGEVWPCTALRKAADMWHQDLHVKPLSTNEAQLSQAAGAVRMAQVKADELQRRRDEMILETSATAYRLAQVTGLSETMIGKIRKRSVE